MFSLATKIPLNQLLGLGFNPNGRQIIKESFEQLDGNAGMFEEFMFDLEKIHTIEKLSWFGHGNQLANPMPTNITLAGGATFDGNFQVQDELMNKTQRNLMASFILNNDEYYILANYEKVLNSLTTETLKTDFANAIAEIRAMTDPQSLDQRGGGRGQ